MPVNSDASRLNTWGEFLGTRSWIASAPVPVSRAVLNPTPPSPTGSDRPSPVAVREWWQVAQEGALPFLALALLRGPEVEALLEETRGLLGIVRPEASPDHYYLREFTPLESLAEATVKTWTSTLFTVRMLGRMVTGDVSIKNISGPINIAQFAGDSAQRGLNEFLAFLALISISLGVLNLLPVPMLDGGHLLYYAVEAVKGSPVSEATMTSSGMVVSPRSSSMRAAAFVKRGGISST